MLKKMLQDQRELWINTTQNTAHLDASITFEMLAVGSFSYFDG